MFFLDWFKPKEPETEVVSIPPEDVQAMQAMPDELKWAFSNSFKFQTIYPNLFLTLGVYGGCKLMQLLDKHGYEIRKKENGAQG